MPQPLAVYPPAIPQELVDAGDRWVTWTYVDRDGRPTKVPCDPRTGQWAKSDTPLSWANFLTAHDAYCTHPDAFAGVGFMLLGGDVCGIDLDHCRDPQTGLIDEWAREIVQRVNTYTEISPSGAGIRAFCRGALPPGRRRGGHIEIYGPEDRRYLSVTGHHLAGTPETLNAVDLIALHRDLFGDAEPNPEPHQAAPKPLTRLDDREVLDKAFAARNGAMTRALFNGDLSGNAGMSEATQAFLQRVAFYTRDPEQLDRIIRSSGLMREKWDRPQSGSTWGALEIAHALATVPADRVYSPPSGQITHGVLQPSNPVAKPAISGSPLDLIELAGIQAEEVRWLWPSRVPLGKLTIQDGDPNQGKTTVLTDLAARVSRGLPMPLESPDVTRESAHVLMIFCEDDVADTVVPRLDAAGADRRYITALRRNFTIPSSLHDLEHVIRERGTRLVVIDPILGYMDEDVKVIAETSVRKALDPLVDLAQRTGVAVIANRHLNKANGQSALQRGAQSGAFSAQARSGWLIGSPTDDDQDVRILAMTKNNLCARPESIRFRIVAGTQPRIEWLGLSAMTADQLVGAGASRDPEAASKTEAAADWLRVTFDNHVTNAIPVEALMSMGKKAGHTSTALTRARNLAELIEERRAGVGRTWVRAAD